MSRYLHRTSGEVVWYILRNLRAILVISSFVIQSSHNPEYILNGLLYTHLPCMNPKLQGGVYVYLDNAYKTVLYSDCDLLILTTKLFTGVLLVHEVGTADRFEEHILLVFTE